MNSEVLTALLDEFTTLLAPKVAAELRKSPGSNPNELLTVPDIARELGVSRENARQLVTRGVLSRVPDYQQVRVSRRELERYTAGKAKSK